MRAHALDDRHAENQQHKRHREATTHQHVAEHPRRHVPELTKPTPYGGRLTRGAGMARSRKPANAGRGHSCTESSSHWFEPAKPNRNPNRTPFHHVTGLQHVEGSSNSRYQVVLPKTRVISQRHNQAPNAPAPTWNRQLLRPNHCSWPTSQRRGTNCNACR